jgi:hypothetical protein
MESKINSEWHAKNKMPKNPTFEQRVKWHLAIKKIARVAPSLINSLKK